MEKIDTRIPGLFIIKLDIFYDERGFFTEKYNKAKLQELDIKEEFVQDNHSRSNKFVLRGLHAQQGQGKLIGASSGIIYDVAVDIRKNSQTYGEYVGIELSAENGLLLWIPDGFLHGFQVLSEIADVTYKVTDFYNPATQFGVSWCDPDLSINWPNQKNAILNSRDQELPNLKDIKSEV